MILIPSRLHSWFRPVVPKLYFSWTLLTILADFCPSRRPPPPSDPSPPSHKKAYNNKIKNKIICAYSTCINVYMTGTLHVGFHVLTYVQIWGKNFKHSTQIVLFYAISIIGSLQVGFHVLTSVQIQCNPLISTSTGSKFLCRYMEMSIYKNNGKVRNK